MGFLVANRNFIPFLLIVAFLLENTTRNGVKSQTKSGIAVSSLVGAMQIYDLVTQNGNKNIN